jgi:ABC-type dipeptide/oligopeptide/nickel transport system ATPase subunit
VPGATGLSPRRPIDPARPGASLNPRFPAWRIVDEPFAIVRHSGFGPARALALRPQLLILDESLASLDLSIQAQMINLLLDLQCQFCLTYVLISHDLALAGHLADQIAVL